MDDFNWKVDAMILGIDLGRTIVRKIKGVPVVYEGAFEVIRKLSEQSQAVFVISKVNEEQEVRSRAWLKEVDFSTVTGICLSKVHYCRTRPEKGPICKKLGITHFIDDRAEVMYHLPKRVNKYLFQPDVEEMKKFPTNSKVVQSWKEIERLLL